MVKKNERCEASRTIAKAILEQYKPTPTEEMQDALRDIFGPMLEAMLQGRWQRKIVAEGYPYKFITHLA